MQLVNELLDYSVHHDSNIVHLFTGNSVIKSNGALVMGAGVAKVVRDLYPGIDIMFGNQISHYGYYYVLFTSYEGKTIGVFQTKVNYRDKTPLSLLKTSVNALGSFAHSNSNMEFHMNYPAIGHGQLLYEDVRGIVEELPDNVYLYK